MHRAAYWAADRDPCGHQSGSRLRWLFTWEDSDRLVRIEEKTNEINATLVAHHSRSKELEQSIERVKSRQRWIMGVGSAIAFLFILIAHWWR